jgi:hypothetical protein
MTLQEQGFHKSWNEKRRQGSWARKSSSISRPLIPDILYTKLSLLPCHPAHAWAWAGEKRGEKAGGNGNNAVVDGVECVSLLVKLLSGDECNFTDGGHRKGKCVLEGISA